MNPFKFRPLPLLVALSLTVAAAPAAAGDTLQLLAATPQDLVASRLVMPKSTPASVATLERAPVAVSWPLDGTRALDAEPQINVTQSREYWIDATEAEIQNGVRLPLSATGALVRLSPHDGKSAIAEADVQIRVNGKRIDNAKAIDTLANSDDLHAAGMDVPGGSVILRMGKSVRGDLQLSVPTARGAYLVHVFEPASPVVLALKAERDSIVGGDPVAFRATIEGATLERIGGLLSAPDGASQNVDFTRQADGSYVGSVTPHLAHAGAEGLWEIHAFGVSTGKDGVPRDARSAFAVSVPVARLDGRVSQSKSNAQGGALSLRIGVEARTASRYALSGVLYGTDADGKLQPVAMAQSAAWLPAGRGTIDLRYDAASLSLGAPWEVRDLRLLNQADFSLQERRARALAWR